MKNHFLLGTIGVAVSFMALTGAHAAPVTALYNTCAGGPTLGKAIHSNLDLSNYAVAMLNVTKTLNITGSVGGTVTLATSTTTNTSTNVTTTKLTAVKLSHQLTSVTYEQTTGQVLNEHFDGAVTIENHVRNPALTGGSLTLSSLDVDFVTATVYATVQGENGVGTRQRVALFTFAPGNPVPNVNTGLLPPPAGYTYPAQLDMSLVPASIPTLTLTREGAALWAQSLGYSSLGTAALQASSSNMGKFSTSP